MYIHDYEKELMNLEAYRLHKNLMLYIPPILLMLGTVGNVFSAVILTQKPMRKYSTYFYLAVLSTADIFVLYIGLLRMWIGEITGYDIRNQNAWACKLISVFGYTFSDFSGWLIVVVTVERYVAVCYPLKATNVCSRSRAIKMVMILLLLLLGINLHFMWTVGLNYIYHNNEEIAHCSGGYKYHALIDEIWPWIDAFIYSFIPFLVILVLNIFIIRQVVRARWRRQQLGNTERGKLFLSRSRNSSSASSDSSKITLMLLTISVTFLVTTLPVSVTSIATMFLTKDSSITLESLVLYRLVRTITELLMYLNHSINFFLYCATGQKFRQQLMSMVAQHRKCGGGVCIGESNHMYGAHPLQSSKAPVSDYSLCLLTQNCAHYHQRKTTGSTLLSPNVLLWPKHSNSNSLTVTLQVNPKVRTTDHIPLKST